MDEQIELTPIAAPVVDIWMGGDQTWRTRLHDSDFLESADWQNAMEIATAAHSVIAGKVAELEGVAQQAADALYPFISMIAHAFDEDGRHYWTRDPTEAEAQAALKATNAVSAALAPYPERRHE